MLEAEGDVMTRGRIWWPKRRRSDRVRTAVAERLAGREPTNELLWELCQTSASWFGEQLSLIEINDAARVHQRRAASFAVRARERKAAIDSPCSEADAKPLSRPTPPGPGIHSPGSGVP